MDEDKQLGSDSQYYVGVDGGGTKCRAQVFDFQGQCLGTGVGGPANIAREPDGALHSLVESVTAALADAGLAEPGQFERTPVAAGLAGANVPSANAMLSHWQHPFYSFCFTSDLHTAILGAHLGRNGAVLITGTGSCAAALHDGKLIQSGGHGFQLGDKGSGAWLGRQAASYTLEAMDGVVGNDPLVDAVLQHYQAEDSADLVNLLNLAAPAQFAELAPLVLQLAQTGNSEVAGTLVQSGADYLSEIARRALLHCEGKLVLAGGLAEKIQPWLADDVLKAIVEAQSGPEWGAVLYMKSCRKAC
ncbi:hypothetical protein DXV75_06450 [Alteromonas aestuariivivens]|uniref:ATPase BadF/BadG/BcrA/BcrD type domain-containing protein n=1 Tax=Alteromonas aestuariivivens TaxID=1938339 RepID=A0A3D8MAH6_9ALTE|nr:BadF/BadG/BcrA/BcrD ATPase family protein [Alteromonas aestuariivivens]RDV26850.1 hypothetical protein DXV75_06450 [Alteromonas aestuariivivens]